MRSTRDQKLRSKLWEDLGSDSKVDNFLSLAQSLQGWSGPKPTNQSTQLIIKQMLDLAETNTGRMEVPQVTSVHLLLSPLPYLILHSQAKLIYREIWSASWFVLLLGFIFTWIIGKAETYLPFVLIIPVVAAVGISFIYGQEVDPAIEIELATRISPYWILLARLTLVFTYNLILGLVASGILATTIPSFSFWIMVSAWLGPMALLSGFSFFVTVLSGNSSIGVILSLTTWGIINVLRLGVLPSVVRFDWITEMFTSQAAPVIWIVAVVFCIAGLWLAGSEERWLQLKG